MKTQAEIDILVYGATGYTGRLIAESLMRDGSDGLSWAMAGRSLSKLEQVRDEIGAPANTPLVTADAQDATSLRDMTKRARCVITTVGPYQLYGSELVAACAATGTDYVDLSGEPAWMHAMIQQHDAQAKASGARLVFSCGFDSVPFDMGNWFLQQGSIEQLGSACQRVNCRVLAMNGKFSGGTAASLSATMAAVGKDPSLVAVLTNPYSLTMGFEGPTQPDDSKIMEDPDTGKWVAPFIMAAINTKNVHRTHALLGHPWGKDFLYQEMMIAGEGEQGKAAAEFIATLNPLAGDDVPKPGEGPTKEERETGNYDLLFIGHTPSGKEIRARVTGDKDPGYGSTSRMISQCAQSLLQDCAQLSGGFYTPGAAFGMPLINRMTSHAGLTFNIVES